MTPIDRELVLDASVLAKWFRSEREENVDQALRLMEDYETGRMHVIVPPLLFIELLSVAQRHWAVTGEAMTGFAARLLTMRFRVQQPDLVGVGRWASRGLTAYDACYVALAEERRTVVITADRQILSTAGPLAVALA